MTVLAAYDFEGQTPGANATATSPWAVGAGSNTLVVNADAKVHGAVGGRIAGASSYKTLDYSETSTSATRVVDVFYKVRNISANALIIGAWDGGSVIGQVRVNAARTVAILNVSTAVATSVATLTVGDTYRFSWMISTSGQTLRVYDAAGTLLFTLTGALTSATRTVFRVGLLAASASAQFDFDTIRIGDDWLDPVVEPDEGVINLWNGSGLVPVEPLGVWNGTTVDDVELLGVWNGTSIDPVET